MSCNPAILSYSIHSLQGYRIDGTGVESVGNEYCISLYQEKITEYVYITVGTRLILTKIRATDENTYVPIVKL